MDSVMQNLDTVLICVFAAAALASALLMLVLPEPMRVAMALISTMVCLGVIFGLLGVHFVAAFQVLIYVGAVMVFMVYAIMLLDSRDPTMRHRYSGMLLPGIVAGAVFFGVLGLGLYHGVPQLSGASVGGAFGIAQFSVAFLDEYWLHFELTSVLLLAAVVAALAVIKVNRRQNG